MNKEPHKVRLSIDCSPEDRQRIKLLCTLDHKTISEFVMECVHERLHQEKRNLPNRKTAKALRESERGEGVETYDSIEALFSKLDLPVRGSNLLNRER